MELKNKILLSVGAASFVVAGTAFGKIWKASQVRKNICQDHQSLLSFSSFHTAILVKIFPDEEAEDTGGIIPINSLNEKLLLEPLAGLKKIAEKHGAKFIYAGQRVLIPVKSKQLETKGIWDGLIIFEWASLQAYRNASQSPDYDKALHSFIRTYSSGFHRSSFFNMCIPVGLSMMRFIAYLKGIPNVLPLKKKKGALIPRAQELHSQMIRNINEVGDAKTPILIFNLIKPGNKEQAKNDAEYTNMMMLMFAEINTGPIHWGETAIIEGNAQFRTTLLVHYPSKEFFCGLMKSEFMNRVGKGKQLGDSVALMTTPIHMSKL